MSPDLLTEALCAAIVALLSDAVTALRADHFEGAEERIDQAHAIQLMIYEASAEPTPLCLLRANALIEAVASAAHIILMDLDDQEAEAFEHATAGAPQHTDLEY